MGQRSQIYVRWNTQDGKMMLVPRYYQWNYGTRMISRARGIIGWLEGSGTYLDCGNEEKLRRIMDINFDYKDVVLGHDIIKEWKEYCNGLDFNDTVFFGQDNNDGKLLIDMHIDWKCVDRLTGKDKISFKYAFLTDEDDSPVMNGDEYMQWDEGGYEDAGYKVWRDNPYLKKEIKYTERNIKWIDKHAKLMTAEEVKRFTSYNYAADMGLLIEIPFT